VKTRTSRECAEFLSLFSSFDGDCQSGSFLIQRNRDKLSARKFDVGVFTQPAPTTDISARIKEAALTCPRPDDAYAVGRAIVCLRFTENRTIPGFSRQVNQVIQRSKSGRALPSKYL
jgi:hypothetical protein